MPRKVFLHESKDFKELIQIVANQKQILPILVEKDYWLMHCLWGLKDKGFKFKLKGGTSLSKGFNLINRFSEDVDIHIEPPKELGVKVGKNQNRAAQIDTRRRFFEWLVKNLQISGILSIVRDETFDNKTLHNGGIRLTYKREFNLLSAVKPDILLEAGFYNITPTEARDISSWAFDYAIQRDSTIFDNRALQIPCYLPEFTLVEKLDAILGKFRQQQEKGEFPQNFLRHYYDVYALLTHSRVSSFVGTPEYQECKSKKFGNINKNCDIAKAEAFLLSEPKNREIYTEQYKRIEPFFYKTPPSFEVILGTIQKFADKL